MKNAIIIRKIAKIRDVNLLNKNFPVTYFENRETIHWLTDYKTQKILHEKLQNLLHIFVIKFALRKHIYPTYSHEENF